MFITWPFIRSRPLKLEFDIPTSRTKMFWEGVAEGEIRTTRCRKCGTLLFPPVADCPRCRSSEMDWVDLEGCGEIEAFTHVIAKPTSFQGMEPYTIAIARLVDGVNVLAWLREAEITGVEVGMRVKLAAGTTPEGEIAYWFVPD
jgi:uncharacterized OB-fold protein